MTNRSVGLDRVPAYAEPSQDPREEADYRPAGPVLDYSGGERLASEAKGEPRRPVERTSPVTGVLSAACYSPRPGVGRRQAES